MATHTSVGAPAHQRQRGIRVGSGSRGLTLIELVISLAVLAVLASLAVPSFAQQLHRQRLKAAAENLATDLAEARFEAARRGLPLHVSFVPGAAWCYAVATAPGCDCTTAQQCQLKTVRASDLPGVQLITSQDGSFDPAGGAITATSALLGTRQGERLRIALSPLGRARVCAPDDSVGGYPRC
jgi:type IV fimbrial biogenesis protein FimT